jgi:hypothetical protein
MFDFDKAIKEASEAAKSPLLGAIVLGSSGSGKSSLMGTSGLKTLYLYTTGEDHGVKAAQAAAGSDIVPVCLDYADGKKLDADTAYQRTLDVLGSVDALKKMGVGMVAVDGASEIEAIIRDTKAWQRMCLTGQGKHNAFAEPTSTVSMFRPVINGLKDLQRNLGVHFVISCILDVKDLGPHGEILEAAPRLQGYSVAESVLQQFGDVLVVGKMERDSIVKYKVQFMTDLVKQSKDEKGTLKRAMNFAPRLTGLQNLPPMVDADLKEILKMKAGK